MDTLKQLQVEILWWSNEYRWVHEALPSLQNNQYLNQDWILNLKGEIEKVSLTKFGNSLRDLLNGMLSNYTIIIKKLDVTSSTCVTSLDISFQVKIPLSNASLRTPRMSGIQGQRLKRSTII